MMTNHTHATTSRYIEERARGGVGLMSIAGINIGVSSYGPAPGRFALSTANDLDAVLPNPTTLAGIAYFDDLVIPRCRAAAKIAHDHGVVAVSQIHHTG